MSRLFDERERAAETLFVRREERLFLERRRSVQALAGWASQAMGHDALTTELYELDLTAAFVNGADDATLLKRVASNLKAENVGTSIETLRVVFAQAWRDADTIGLCANHLINTIDTLRAARYASFGGSKVVDRRLRSAKHGITVRGGNLERYQGEGGSMMNPPQQSPR